MRAAAAQFAGLLLQEAFKPLAKALGFYGDIVVSASAQAIARSEQSGLTDALARAMGTGHSS
jgi:hypothetical protein